MTTTTATTFPPPLLIQKLSDQAVIPTRGSEWSAGLDLSSAKNMTIPAGGRAVVPTDLAIACPAGTYGRIAPRSGLAVKKGIDVGAGVIDADYRGPVGVVLFNLGEHALEVKQGDRIAQLILEQIFMSPVQVVTELDDTVRGTGGFGSTGVVTTNKKQKLLQEKEEQQADTSIAPTVSAEEET
jgi:deoxyuridine 5'-triphosphate nucleotidohydrolase